MFDSPDLQCQWDALTKIYLIIHTKQHLEESQKTYLLRIERSIKELKSAIHNLLLKQELKPGTR